MRQPYAMSRRYALPFETSVEGEPEVSYGAEIDRCAIIAPTGRVKIGNASLSQCVIVEPCGIADGVVAVAAILQGNIGFGCRIDAHADVRGLLAPYVTVHTGALIEEGATIGEGAEILDGAVIRHEAIVEPEAVVGVQADVGARAYVGPGARVPGRASLAPGRDWRPTEARLGEEMPTGVAITLIEGEGFEEPDDAGYDDEDEDEEFDWDGEQEWHQHGGSGRDMVRGSPYRILGDYRPGTARSWVLTKLARLAAFQSTDGRIHKKLIRELRPDLLDHPVVAEVLRTQPPLTTEQLNEMSWAALGTAAYDVWAGIEFHSGPTPSWQMLGPRANNVFVLSVPEETWTELTERLPYGDRRELQEALFQNDQDWHPDRGIPRAIGWVRTVLYPHAAVVVVEIQSDRPWMGFTSASLHFTDDNGDQILDEGLWDEAKSVAAALRSTYQPTFAEDALNIIVEWAFTERYAEVLVLDYKSRKALGGTPPRDFYDKFPKRYTVSAPQPLPDFVHTWDWAKEHVKARRIIPNRRDP